MSDPPPLDAEPRLVPFPVQAWKTARMGLHRNGRVMLIPGVGGIPHAYFPGVLTQAACLAADDWSSPDPLRRPLHYRPRHRVPHPPCACGYYAHTAESGDRPKRERELDGAVLLDVELSGRVMVCDRGYRAERLRAVGITVSGHCRRCHDMVGAEARATAVCFAEVEGGEVWPVCRNCRWGWTRPTHDFGAVLGPLREAGVAVTVLARPQSAPVVAPPYRPPASIRTITQSGGEIVVGGVAAEITLEGGTIRSAHIAPPRDPDVDALLTRLAELEALLPTLTVRPPLHRRILRKVRRGLLG